VGVLGDSSNMPPDVGTSFVIDVDDGVSDELLIGFVMGICYDVGTKVATTNVLTMK
jgi:hypothetical protein